jgi:hypothetical protein
LDGKVLDTQSIPFVDVAATAPPKGMATKTPFPKVTLCQLIALGRVVERQVIPSVETAPVAVCPIAT